MKISKKLNDKINDQITLELESAYFYLSMANHFETLALSGMACWMRKQWCEENEHALKFMAFVNERDGKVALRDLKQLKSDFGSASPLAMFEAGLKHERVITEYLKKLLKEIRDMNDYVSEKLLLWYLNEQVEEEGKFLDIVDHLKLIGNDGPGLLEYNEKLGER